MLERCQGSLQPQSMATTPEGGPAADDGRGAAFLLRLASMNLSGLRPSAVAPSGWTAGDQCHAVQNELLRNDPHVLALQECPFNWAADAFAEQGYEFVGSVAAHAGQVALLVRKGAFARCHRVRSGISRATPAVVAVLELPSGESLYVASVHLEPFEGGSSIRLQQMQDLRKLVTQDGGTPLIIAGDTNMRDSEDATYESVLSLRDAWKDAAAGASSEETRFTWDTVDHAGVQFNEYYGAETRQYQCRYDRVYYCETSKTRLRAVEFGLIANRPVPPSTNHFLSDHFGMAVSFQVG